MSTSDQKQTSNHLELQTQAASVIAYLAQSALTLLMIVSPRV